MTLSRTSALLLASLLAGCGGGEKLPEMGTVTGQVTDKGKPIPMAMVVFNPVERQAVPSSAQTDADGRYTLHYKNGDSGAVLGKHKVEVQTGGTSADPTKPAPPPKTYAVTDEKSVAAGENTFNFDISTLGKPRE